MDRKRELELRLHAIVRVQFNSAQMGVELIEPAKKMRDQIYAEINELPFEDQMSIVGSVYGRREPMTYEEWLTAWNAEVDAA